MGFPSAHSFFPSSIGCKPPVLQWEALLGNHRRAGWVGPGPGQIGSDVWRSHQLGSVSLHAWRGAGWDGCQSHWSSGPREKLGASFTQETLGVTALQGITHPPSCR